MMSSQRRHDGTDQNVQLGEDGGNASNAQDAHQLQDPQTSRLARLRSCTKLWDFNGILMGFNGILMGFYGDEMGWKQETSWV